MTDGSLVLLAALMGLVTYSTRVVPFLVPLSNVPHGLQRAMRLMGPATLASVAAVSVASASLDPGATPTSSTTIWLATGASVALVAARRNLALGIGGALAAGALLTWLSA